MKDQSIYIELRSPKKGTFEKQRQKDIKTVQKFKTLCRDNGYSMKRIIISHIEKYNKKREVSK